MTKQTTIVMTGALRVKGYFFKKSPYLELSREIGKASACTFAGLPLVREKSGTFYFSSRSGKRQETAKWQGKSWEIS